MSEQDEGFIEQDHGTIDGWEDIKPLDIRKGLTDRWKARTSLGKKLVEARKRFIDSMIGGGSSN